MYLADTLSRAYLPPSKNTQGDFEMVNVLKILLVSEEKHDEILRHTSKDEVLQLLKEDILTGWPADKKSLPAVLNPYYSYQDEQRKARVTPTLQYFQHKTPLQNI